MPLLGYGFVHWANKPENVAALKQKRKDDAARKAEDEKQAAELAQRYAGWKVGLKLAFNEDFADNRFHYLKDTLSPKDTTLMVKDHTFKYDALLTKGVGTYSWRYLSKEEFGDFAAEVTFSVWGDHGYAGVTWEAGRDKDGNPVYYDAYANPSNVFVDSEDSDHEGLGGFLEAVNQQTIRVEKLGRSLKVYDNGKKVHDELLPRDQPGKVGIYLGQRGGVDTTSSVSIAVKSLKVWQ